MGGTLLVQFRGFRAERDLIAKMLLSYGELEFFMLDILTVAINDSNAAIRTMYQLRSEANRLAVAEALCTPKFATVNLGGQFKEGVTAMFHCKNIRNQFAHCTWISNKGVLNFANLEEPAKTTGEAKAKVTAHPITRALLQQQFAYFEYTSHMLLWLTQQYRKKTNQELLGPMPPKPRQLVPPKLHSHGLAPRPLWLAVGKLRLLPKLPQP